MNDIEKVHPDGMKETDKSLRLGFPEFSDDKQINLIKVN
jgi:hypothetical protein